MIQSRFQQQHASKHPQRPENGGSGPKPMPASRDAVDTVALKKRMSADSARVTNGSKRAIADNETAVHLLDPRAKKAAFRDVDDKLTDVRLGAARYKARSDTLETERSKGRAKPDSVDVHFAEGDSEWTERMSRADHDAMNSLFRGRTRGKTKKK